MLNFIKREREKRRDADKGATNDGNDSRRSAGDWDMFNSSTRVQHATAEIGWLGKPKRPAGIHSNRVDLGPG
jgi:hypothetical protein